jgi:hypothetical protein
LVHGDCISLCHRWGSGERTVSAVAMLARQFSSAILAGAWPQNDPSSCFALSAIHHRKGVELLGCADEIQTTTTQLVTAASGQTIEAFQATCTELSATITGHADQYFAMARTSQECGHIVAALREDLDRIDYQAHRQIHQILRAASGGPAAAMARMQAIQVIAQARAAASATSGTAATAIVDQGANLGIAPTAQPGGAKPTAAGPEGQIINPGTTGPTIQQVDNTVEEPSPPAPPAPAAQPAAPAEANPTPGGLLSAAGGGCLAGGMDGGLVGAPIPITEIVTVPGGCVGGALIAGGMYLGGIWVDNMVNGNG